MDGRRDGDVAAAARPRAARNAVLALLVLLFSLSVFPAAAGATTLERLTIEDRAQRAVLVVEGTVLGTTIEQTAGDVRTVVRLRVDTAFKGAPGDVVTFLVPGGTLPDGTMFSVDAMPAFSPGEACYVFVDVRGWVIAGFQGKIPVIDGRIHGKGAKRAAVDERIRAALGSGAAAQRSLSGPEGEPAPAPASSADIISAPVITSVSPDSAPAGIDAPIVITGRGFGAIRGWVEFTYGHDDVERIEAEIESWSDTRIECTVPTAVIKNYSASAGSGPMWVTTVDLRESPPFTFSVPFSYGGERWSKPQVTYFLNTSGIDDALRESLVDAGTATWNAAGSGFTFVDGGRTSATISQDGKNVISWAYGLPSGVIAQSSSWSGGGIIQEADIRYSNDYDWGDGSPGSGTMDVQSIAMHEVGHWLTLNDLYGPGDTSKVMYGFGDYESIARTLSAGDVAGIKWIYPIDTQAPQVGARNATAKKNQTVKIYFRVYDDVSAEVASEVQIVTRNGNVKKSWSWDYGENYDGWWWVKYKVTLAKGKYAIIVTGTDLVGNSAKGFATLTVK